MAKLGMDIDAVRGLADRLDGQAQAVVGIMAAVDGLVRRASSEWYGSSSVQFVSDWNSHFKPAMQRAHDSIAGLASSARRNADDQTRGSAAGSAAVPTSAGLTALWGGDAQRGSARVGGSLLGVHAQHSGHLGVVPVAGEASFDASASLTGHSRADLSLRNGANASIAGGALLGLSAGAAGRLGTREANLVGRAHAFGGVRASGDADLHAGLDGVSGEANLGGFAGVEGDASATAHIPGADARAGVEGELGIGAHAHVEAEMTARDIKTSVDLGAAVGLGGGVKVQFDIKPEEILERIPKIW